MFEIVYDDGRMTDGCRLDGYTISSPCEPNGSGELKTNALISCAVTAQLICAFVSAYAKNRFSHDAAHI